MISVAPKRIVISGASGLIGRALVPFLRAQGHTVLRLVRRAVEGAEEIYWNPVRGELEVTAFEGVDAVIHLAGENVAAGRWTRARKVAIRESRVGSTHLLVETMRRMSRPPAIFISASATGYYGYDGEGDSPTTERSPMGKGFLAEVCAAWEAEARRAESSQTRVIVLRFGLVLAAEGGALRKMLPVFRLGLGGHLGSGRQGMSWIARDDVIGALQYLLAHPECTGVFNATAPKPVSNKEFTATLGQVLRRPAALPVPGVVLHAFFGEMAREALLGGVRAMPERLLAAGYAFQHETLEAALRRELG